MRVRVSSRRLVMHVILRFLRENGYRYFTYRSLRAYIFRNRIPLEWHTVERVIRRLAEEGLLERIYTRKRRVRFYPTPRLLEEVMK